MVLNTYNVQGDVADLQCLLNELPAVMLDEKFASNDWDVTVPDDHVDVFVAWCEDHDVSAKLV